MASPKPRNLADSILAAAKKAPRPTATVKVRAIARGYYGIVGPLADLIEPGTVFSLAVSAMETAAARRAREADLASRADRAPTLLPFQTIAHGGVEYALPAWVVDANTPIDADEDEDAPVLAGVSSSDVI